jgi:hypothetical protein
MVSWMALVTICIVVAIIAFMAGGTLGALTMAMMNAAAGD